MVPRLRPNLQVRRSQSPPVWVANSPLLVPYVPCPAGTVSIVAPTQADISVWQQTKVRMGPPAWLRGIVTGKTNAKVEMSARLSQTTE
jgi:hypothetical protein